MSKTENQDYKSPLRKLVTFFENSRNQWKEKYQLAKKTIKRLSNRVRYLEQSKEQWKQKAIALEQELKQMRVENKSSVSKKKVMEPVVSNQVPEPFQVVPFQHQYSK